MEKFSLRRRRFLKNGAKVASGLTLLSSLPKNLLATGDKAPVVKFAVISVNHSHIYGMIEAMIRGGAKLVAFYVKEPALATDFINKYPLVKQARNEKEILEDPSIQLILSAGIPVERAPLGMEAMRHGKDFLVDKPGITTLQQLEAVRKVQEQTGRLYCIFIERFESPTIQKAGELIQGGAIGTVIQTMGTGPHRINPASRPAWFFDKKYFGGIIVDLGSHQFDQFLFFTSSTAATIVAAQTGNLHHPQYPAFEDFGDVMLKGNNGTGYMRMDWFTPGSLKTYGDGRMTILGTDGYIELRKTIDLNGKEGGNHLFLVNNKETVYMDCSKQPLSFADLFVNDVANRTANSFSQEQCFLAAELAIKAQAQAQPLAFKK